MGRMLGAHDSDELDRPDLNKCPDCRCFFDGDNCPLCGKECPEEMKAGNRAKVKAKRKRSFGNGRVTFVPWYYSWLFIILMFFIMPVAGIILLCTSPYRLRTKIIMIISLIVGYIILTVVLMPLILYAETMLFTFLSSMKYQ